MPRVPKRLCDCGCGQAPAATTRNRKVECPFCDVHARISREQMRLGGLICGSCMVALRPVCLRDAELVGDECLRAHPDYGRARGFLVNSERSSQAARTRARKREALADPVSLDAERSREVEGMLPQSMRRPANVVPRERDPIPF